MSPHAPPQPAQSDAPIPEVAVIVLNWNAAADTLACLGHLARWQQVRPRAWVVDNASRAEDMAALRTGLAALPFPVTLIANPVNAGFAGGTNRGLAAALAAGDAPLLLLNNDARLEDTDCLRLLTTLHSRPDIGWVGPALYARDRLHSLGRRNPVLHYHTLITALPADHPADAPLPVAFISGAIALVRAQVLRTVGLLDEDYFFNTEVADHCARCRAAGYLTVVDPRARGQHEQDHAAPLRSTLYAYYIIRNRFIFIRKRYGGGGWPLLLAWGSYALLLATKLRLSGARGPARAVWLGLWDGLTRRWGGQNARVLAAASTS